MVVKDGPQHGLVAAARDAFWDMSRAEVIKFVAIKGVDVPGGASLFINLFVSIQQRLKVDGHAALDYVRISQHFADHLTHVDAANELVDVQDTQQVLDDQKGALHTADCLQTFKFECATTRQELTDKKRQRQSGPGQHALPVRAMTLNEAALYVPDGASTWQSNTRNYWWGHYPPYMSGEDLGCCNGRWRDQGMLWSHRDTAAPALCIQMALS